MLSPRAYQLAQLAAIKHARRALRDLGLESEAWIDPFAAIERAGALLFFAPLRGLCGAYMPRLPEGDAAGVLVSITYPLSVQRFTAAHELGHLRMGHSPSVDKEEDILPRGPVDQTGGLGTTEEEVKAEAFAAHFLMPMRRVSERIGNLGLNRADLNVPDTVYELSLWFGVSYSAMAWHLATLKQIDRPAVQRLLETKPREIKQEALGRDVVIDWHNDVWSLSARHSGEIVHARVGDALTITLPSHATGGYVWDVGAIDSQSLEVLRMEPVPGAAQPRDEALLVGSSRPQRAILRVKALGEHPISLLERRMWEPSNESARFRLTIVAEGVPERGLSPKQRQALIRA